MLYPIILYSLNYTIPYYTPPCIILCSIIFFISHYVIFPPPPVCDLWHAGIALPANWSHVRPQALPGQDLHGDPLDRFNVARLFALSLYIYIFGFCKIRDTLLGGSR